MSASGSFWPTLTTRSTAALSSADPVRPNKFAQETLARQKLGKAAGEFESMLLSSLWKSMKSTFASSDDPSDDSDDPAHETLDDMGIQAMSSAVGKAGGLGLGKLILKHLEPMLAHSTNEHGPQLGKASPFPADTFLETR
jgi:Rod binding domain-containing protein